MTLVISPPVSDILINGHTYTNAQLQANPAGWLGGIANDIGLVTTQYPKGRFAPRVTLTSDLTMYVDPAGSDLNNGLIGNPCATIQRPFDLLRDGYDLAGHTVTVQVSNGNYSPGLKLRGRFIGQQSPASLVLLGNPGSPSSVTIGDATVPTNNFETGNGCGVYTTWGALLTVNGVKLTGGYRCLWANDHSNVRFLNVEVGSSTTESRIVASNSAITRLRGNISISGSSPGAVARGLFGGQTYLSDIDAPLTLSTVTLIGNPTFGFFARANALGQVISFASQTTYVGTGIGQKYTIGALSLISTNGSGINYFPGNIAGDSGTTGGLYT